MRGYEMRIDSLCFDTTKTYEDIRVFGFGHESCIQKFFFLTEKKNLMDFLLEQRRMGKEIRIVTPFVPERHLKRMKEVIIQLLKMECFYDSTIIVNDYGLMNFLHRTDRKIKICLGRCLLFSFSYAPWGEKMYEDESPDIRKVVSQISFYDQEKMEFFRNLHVEEIEVNCSLGIMESLKKIQDENFRVNIHLTDFLYGAQRSCYIRRQAHDGSCNGLECETPMEIRAEALWSDGEYYDIPAETEFPDLLYIRGNKIYGDAREMSYDWCNGLIII